MATVKQHYEEVLADVYSWMYGGFENGLQRNRDFIKKHGLKPKGSALALDLGAGSGFQSIPLAEAGYHVTAVDLSRKLLDELKAYSKGLPIAIVQGDLMEFDIIVDNKPELIVCMTDTILYLDSKDMVSQLFSKVFTALEPGGRFVISFRDFTHELKDQDRFIPVRSDDTTVFTCFLEYEPEYVKVHDIVYRKTDDKWNLFKSFYRKLRLSREWVEEHLLMCGFKKIEAGIENGFITMVTQK
jgi:predicted TPR repeat methyltransferase